MMQDKEIKALISLLYDDDQNVLLHVEEKILSMGYPIIPYLETEWERSSTSVVHQKITKLIHTLHYEKVKARLKKWYSSNSQDLLTGMWVIATYQYPNIQLENLKKDINKISHAVESKLYPNIYPLDQVKIINNVLFSQLKFRANNKNFYSPNNLLINVTLETRKGNPITLSVIYLLIAQKLKLPIYGVNLPNLFILTYKSRLHIQFYINAYNLGIILSKQELENYIAELHIPPQNSFFEPCNTINIIRRALYNLILSFEKMNESIKANEVKVLLGTIEDG